MLLAVIDQWVSIGVVVKAKCIKTDTLTRRKVESLSDGGLWAFVIQVVRCVEVWNAFTAQAPREKILVIVDDYGHIVLTKLID